ncbi:glycosyltransferase family 2 protein [Paenibacillus aceris]|uniref:Glycosyltransferase involved in cell wall biosynthesis n=1 Tax=Paenibacillus aceris TaxID=869555 RepID=A0ABS4I2S9_9BACL|nr:glycosyltransferase [Paenibacillus aceris]MBP1965200.1 glycosyltransferase involved in cell wall biosynthesis [Paenibacillus aceris]NHW33177.1 glycosyltransferase [Paenibacillus aceris]
MISPKVSIVIPVYNGSNFLKEAIDSALAQTYSNIEIIVVNDGSTDNGSTDTIARSYGDRIRYFSKSNGGVSTALNLGIEKMTGDYFSWLSHDDVYKPEKVAKQVEFLQSLEGGDSMKTIVYSGYELINDKSRTIDIVDFSKLYEIYQLSTPLFPIFRGLANGCTMLIPKSHFDRVGLFDDQLKTTQDYELWFRMFRGGSVKFSPGTYLKSRVHPNQTGRTNKEHIVECEKLWIAMLNEVSDEEMCEMEGTPYHFYIRTAEFLEKHSTYWAAVEHSRKLAENEININSGKIPIEKMRSTVPTSMSTGGIYYKFLRVLHHVRSDGYLVTTKKILKKF